MKYIRVVSDIHWEFDAKYDINNLWTPKELDTDADTILIIAGDMWYGLQAIDVIETFHKRFAKVLLVLGNHDFYFHDLNTLAIDFQVELLTRGMMNVELLNRNNIMIDDYIFVGATLWTDMKNEDTYLQAMAKQIMYPDFAYIEVNQRVDEENHYQKIHDEFTPKIWLKENQKDMDYIKVITTQNRDKKIIVITHHAPTEQSIHDRFKNAGDTNYYFVNTYHNFIEDNDNIKYWVHGHIHNKMIYDINKTKVIANPRGYPRENNEFDEECIFEL